MKRSRACEDLRALECSSSATAAAASTSPRTGQQHHPLHSRAKRSRRVVDVLVDSDFSDLEELSEGFFAAFRLDSGARIAPPSSTSVSVSPSSSSPSSSTTMSSAIDDDFACPQFDVVDQFANSYDRLGLAAFDECLPSIRRNSRDALPVVECDAVSLTALQFKKKLQLGGDPMMLVDAVVNDAPETDLLGRFPFDKRQAFASLFMLPVNPNR